MAAHKLMTSNGDLSGIMGTEGRSGLRDNESGISETMSELSRTSSPEGTISQDLLPQPASSLPPDFFEEIVEKATLLGDQMSEEDLQLGCRLERGWVGYKVDNLLTQLKKVRASFDNFPQRQILFSNFKSNFRDLYRNHLVFSSDHRTQLMSLVSEGLRRLKSENLTEEKVKAFIETFKVCQQRELQKKDQIFCHDLLKNAGIEII